jgi:transformation/transcription domain-associated protein
MFCVKLKEYSNVTILYHTIGFIDEQIVPFRMTPNVVSLAGQSHIEERFISSFAIVADAVREHKDEFDAILRLLMRDDILAWYSKSLAKSDSKTQELERQLIERVSKNVSTLQSRFAECAPRKQAKNSDSETPVDQRVRNLYAEATSPEKLCMMPISYQGWI